MKKILAFIFSACTLHGLYAQQEYSVFTATGRGVATTFETDYHAAGINPANLGRRKFEEKHVTFGFAEFALSGYSGALGKKDLRQSMSHWGSENFTTAQKIQAASQFASEKFALNADLNWLGISYQSDKAGGFAFNIRETARWYSTFNSTLSQIAFLGYKAPYFDSLLLSNGQKVLNNPSNYQYADSIGIKQGFKAPGTAQLFSQLFSGSKVSFLLTREFNLSYGKEFKINDDLAIAGGVGVKYILGFGMMNIEAKDNKFTGIAAFSPAFGYNFGTVTPSAIATGGYKPVGKGFGLDIAANIYIKENLKFGAALTNVGSITWDGNVYSIKDTALDNIKTEGFNSYNIVKEAKTLTADQHMFKWEGKKQVITALPTTLRLGGSYRFGEDKAEIGADVVIPTNTQPGAISKPYWAVGGDVRLVKFLRLSAGLSHGGNYDKRVNIPVGVTFVVGENGTWEFGASSRDVITYFINKGPALSIAFGFLRFRV